MLGGLVFSGGVSVSAAPSWNYDAWTDGGVIYSAPAAADAYYPSMVYDKNGFGAGTPLYKMWYADGNGALFLVTSANGTIWGTPTTITGLTTAQHEQVLYSASCFGVLPCTGATPKYRMWFWDLSANLYSISSMATAVSVDGIAWTNKTSATQNPALPLVTGVSPNWNDGTYGPVNVLYQPSATNTGTDPWDYSYTLYYDATDGSHETTGLAYSTDGLYWNAYAGNAPVLNRSATGGSQAWHCISAAYGTIYKDYLGYHYFFSSKGKDDGAGGCATLSNFNAIGHAVSSDGKVWTKDASPIFQTSDGVAYRTDRIYTPSVIDDGSGTLRMYFSAKDLAGGPKKIGYATLPKPAFLHISESVVNGNGSTATAANFTVHLKTAGADVADSPVAATTSPGTLYALAAGTYSLSQNAVTNYSQSFGGACSASGSVSLFPGDDKTCTVTTVALTPTQTAPDTSGAAVISSATPQVVVASSTQAVSITTTGSGISGVGIDVSPLVTAGAGVLPQINITAANTNNDTVAIPDNTAVISSDAGWNGIMLPPTATTATLPVTAGVTKTLISATEIGATSTSLSFDRGVRLVFPGQAGKLIGHMSATAPLEEISSTCAADSQAVGDALLADGDCKIDVGDDLVVWVRHFTTFVIYTQTGAVAAVQRTGTGAGSYLPARIVPLIGITKIPSPSSLSSTGLVIYHYIVWNVGAQQALTKVTVKDDMCSPVSYLSGDVNTNGKLDTGESWQYQCTATISKTTTNSAVVVGYSDDGYDQMAMATAASMVTVGSAAASPNISITEVPSRVTPLPIGGGEIVYTYAVTNPGMVAMRDVSVADDKCRAISVPTGDTNANGSLDPGETWTYTCRVNVPVSTRNTVTASGFANGITSSSHASVRVLVTATPAAVSSTALAPVSLDLNITKTRTPGTFYRSLSLGSQGADVVALQAFLIQKGYLAMPKGVAAGYFGSLTRTAVIAYQKSAGLPQVGSFGPLTKAKLLSELRN